MIGTTERWFQVSGATPANFDEFGGKLIRMTLLPFTLQPFAQRGRHRSRQAFAGQFGKLRSQPVSILAFYVQLMGHGR